MRPRHRAAAFVSCQAASPSTSPWSRSHRLVSPYRAGPSHATAHFEGSSCATGSAGITVYSRPPFRPCHVALGDHMGT
eukprot:697477-Lingulodinium_polyedra.AAC.1